MNLSESEVERFYAIWFPLLTYVNRRLKVAPDIPPAANAPWDLEQVRTVRDALWADDSLRHDFVAENPAKLSADDRALVASWDQRRQGTFAYFRQLKKHALFILDGTVYGVLGLASRLDETVPFIPCYVEATLLPWGDRIIYDSLLLPYMVQLGPGYRADLEASYRDAVERGAVFTSLRPLTPVEQAARRAATNAKVLEAFRAHLFASGVSVKVAERDLLTATTFAEKVLAAAEPQSLREFGSADLTTYLAAVQADAGLKDAQRRAVVTGLKRFLKFLRDTERMDYDSADSSLDVLKGRE